MQVATYLKRPQSARILVVRVTQYIQYLDYNLYTGLD